jgi:tetratricopeptide (TPR) repeat protein
MKRITFLLLMLCAVTAFAQKAVKPNINKALNSWKDGKLDEAKTMIDLATTYEKTMNDADTWYYRGLIYASLDTTSNATYKALATDPLKTAVESFIKAEQIGKGGKEFSVTFPPNPLPVIKPQQLEQLSNYYLDKGIKKLQEEEDYEGSILYLEKTKQVFENTMKTYSNDTLTYYVLGLAGHYAEKYDTAIESLNKYLSKGGKSKDAYIVLYQIYTGPKEDKEKALATVREARTKIPTNTDFPKLEIGLLIDLNRVDEAKTNLENAIKKEPNNATLHFYLGYVNSQLGKVEEARKNFTDALKAEPAYFEAQYYLANTYLIDVDKTTKEINGLGISAADNKKKPALVQRRVKESEAAIPYLEKAEKMKIPNKDTEIELYQKLSLLYYYIADDKNATRVGKKLKELGVTEE